MTKIINSDSPLNPKPYSLETSSGFTLVETLVGVTLVLTTMLGPFVLAERSIFQASITQNQIIATYLAQEGIEFIRNTRDNNFLQGNNWINGSSLNNCLNSNGCYVDPLASGGAPKINQCSGNDGCPVVSYNSTTGYYTHSGFDLAPTPFVRTVKIDKLPGNDEAEVEVTVNWQERSGPKSFVMTENIFNWRK